MRDLSFLTFFPLLKGKGFRVTSDMTTDYNCIAWAAGDDTKKWWPDPMEQAYWPDDIPREETVPAFTRLYAKFGYIVCKSMEHEEGYEKLAIYVNANGIPTHASRELESGRWTSKLGDHHDIEHTHDGLDKGFYGRVEVIMKRKL